ncbi:MAG: hypothetical protein ACYC6I_08875, partial [Bacillota bacterium]
MTESCTSPSFRNLSVRGGEEPTGCFPKESAVGLSVSLLTGARAVPEQVIVLSPAAGSCVTTRFLVPEGPMAVGAKVTVTLTVSPTPRVVGSGRLVAVTEKGRSFAIETIL